MKFVGIHYHKDSSISIKDENYFNHIEFERLKRIKHYNIIKKNPLELQELINQHQDSILSFVLNDKFNLLDIVNPDDVININYIFSDNRKTYSSKLKKKIYIVDHHLSHASYSYYTRPDHFKNTDILSYDGFGNYTDRVFYNNTKKVDDSYLGLGYLWSNISIIFFDYPYYAGKIMGLAAYGKVNQELKQCLDNQVIFFSREVNKVDFRETRKTHFEILDTFLNGIKNCCVTFSKADISATLQSYSEEVVCDYLLKNRKNDYLCLSGGIALNGYINQLIVEKKIYKDVHIAPACSDEGLSIGANLFVVNKYENFKLKELNFLGKEYDIQRPENSKYLEDRELFPYVAKKLADKKIVGWYQGRSESGPRALGNRSILCDPTYPDMKDYLNERIKHREWYRPFAPIILEEYIKDWFENIEESKHMLKICKFKKGMGELVPSVCHIDYTGRVQSVTRKDNERMYLLIKEFYKIKSIPILLNTSFNDKEPIVETPEDALRTFYRTDIDVLVLGKYVLEKNKKNIS